MRCPNCSNEISQEETFCGQCGTPVILSAKPVNPPGTFERCIMILYYQTQTVYPLQDYGSSGSQQQMSFHQDPTQAMSVLSSNQVQNYPTMYPQNYGDLQYLGYSGTGQYTPQMQLSRVEITQVLYTRQFKLFLPGKAMECLQGLPLHRPKNVTILL